MTAYGSLSEFKASTNITTVDATRDTVIERMLDAAKVLIDQVLNRPDGFTADTEASERYYPGSGKPYQWIDECVEISSVAVKDSASETTYTAWTSPTTNMAGDGDWFGFTGDPEYPRYNVLPFQAIMVDPNGSYSVFTSGMFTTRGGFSPSSSVGRNVPTVKVTAKWGYSVTAPTLIKEVNIAQAARWYKRGQSSWADTLAVGEMGTLIFKELDPDIKQMLLDSRYYKPSVGRR